MSATTKNIPEFLAGGGEMGERIRSFAWNTTPLGNPEHWPQSLKTCVRIMLSSQQPIWIGWGKDLIKLYNDAYIDIVRGKHPFAMGQPARIVWKDIWKDVEPLLSRAMKKDEGTYVESQLLIMERSGFPEETYYTFSYTPVLGDDGKPAGIICYNTADTDRIINERSLTTLQELDMLAQKKTEEGVYQQAAKALKVNNRDLPFALIYKLADDGNIAELASFSGLHDEQKIETQLDLAGTDHLAQSIARLIADNRIIESDNFFPDDPSATGGWDVPPQHIAYVPIRSTTRKHPQAVLVVGLNPYRQLDIIYRNFLQLIGDQISLAVQNALAYEEERRRAQELEALDKAKTLFFTNISHEFRTPIKLMLGPLEELLNRSSDTLDEREKQSLQLTHRNALRLLRLVNSLLDFSRIESGRQKASFVPTTIGAYTKNIVANFRSMLEKASLSLHVEVIGRDQLLYIDREMWEKILFNLLSNAFKYTLRGGITVTLVNAKDYTQLTVSDTGIGIPEKELPHMFDRFHRIENAAGRTYEGSGIGLSLTRELVMLHKGTISVESELGKSSRFIVTIPAGKDHLSPAHIADDAIDIDDADTGNHLYVNEASLLVEAPDTNAAEITAPAATSGSILIVDDNADMRRHLSAIIGSNYPTITATNGQEALDKIRQYAPELVLSDVMMPVMNGIQLLKEIKSDPTIAFTPVILITARAGEESRVEGFETGADDYLVKPFSSNELLARIKAQIRISRTRQNAIAQIRNLFQQAPTAIQILRGPDFVFELVNDQSLSLIGKTREQVIGFPVKDVMPEMIEQGFIDILNRVYTTGERYISDETPIYYKRDGQMVETFERFVYAPLVNEEGAITGIMVTGDDITAQVMARKKIEEAERKLRNVLLQSPGIFVILKGPEMRIDFVNPPLLASWGRTMDIVGKTLDEVLPEIADQGFKQLLDEVYRTGKVIKGKEQAATLVKNGKTEEVYYDFVYQPIFEKDETISGITIMASDVTEQLLARKTIEQSEQKLRTLTETIPQLIWMTDANGVQQFASRRWLEYSGIMPENNASWGQIVHPDDAAIINKAWTKSLSSGERYVVDVRLKSKSGEYRWHYGQAENIKDDEGKIISWIGSFTDINDQKLFTESLESLVSERTHELNEKNVALESSLTQLGITLRKQQELQVKDEQKDDFIMMASHELKTPITTVKGYLQLLLKLFDPESSEPTQHLGVLHTALKTMDKQVTNLTNLISELLDLSKIQKGQLELNKSVFNLADYVHEIVHNAQFLSQHKPNLDISFSCNLYADKNRIGQVLLNFITNAVKYSPHASVIDIRMYDYGDHCVAVSVQDYGIGMEQGDLEKIFDRFYRVEGKKEKTFPGFGIGLFIAKDIITKHGGRILVSSQKNEGSLFTFVIPYE